MNGTFYCEGDVINVSITLTCDLQAAEMRLRLQSATMGFDRFCQSPPQHHHVTCTWLRVDPPVCAPSVVFSPAEQEQEKKNTFGIGCLSDDITHSRPALHWPCLFWTPRTLDCPLEVQVGREDRSWSTDVGMTRRRIRRLYWTPATMQSHQWPLGA